MTARRLEGKVALVTGAGRGMGRAIALRLAAEGAVLIVNYASSREGAEEVVQNVRSQGGQSVAIAADISQRTEVKRLFQRIDSDLGRIDIVVNSAGISSGTPLAQLDDRVTETLLGVNLLGPLYVASEASSRLPSGGRIVNISSSLVEFPFAGSSVYTATKAAMKAFTDVWAKELGPKGITVNTVLPGPTSPGMMDTAPEGYRERFAKASPFSRIGRAEEIAAVVAFLCSPEASWVSGAHILANGAANT
jgi:3-oxoacyl-[acyl-carrier protein] reductase